MNKKMIPLIPIIIIAIVNLFSILIIGEYNIYGAISSIAGITSVTLAAKGHRSCFFFGIIQLLAYIPVSYIAGLYGVMALTIFFQLPMNVWGLIYWKKNLNEDTKLIKTRKLNPRTLLICIFGSMFAALLYSIVLIIFNSSSPFFESLITFFMFIAMYLYVKRYNEQWLFWIFINAVSVWIWINAAFIGDPNGIIMSITWTLYLVKSIYGYFNWLDLMDKEESKIKNKKKK